MTHHCHWNGCPREVPPQKWGCKRHWFMLPLRLRAKIKEFYRAGQELEKNPSRDYIDAVLEAQAWIRENNKGVINVSEQD